MNRLRDREAPGAEGEGMVLGERALALEARRDRGGELLGEAPEGRPRPRVVHPLSGVDERALGLDEEGGDALHVRGVRTRAGAHDRLVVERLRDVLGEHVARHLDDRGAPGGRFGAG